MHGLDGQDYQVNADSASPRDLIESSLSRSATARRAQDGQGNPTSTDSVGADSLRTDFLGGEDVSTDSVRAGVAVTYPRATESVRTNDINSSVRTNNVDSDSATWLPSGESSVTTSVQSESVEPTIPTSLVRNEPIHELHERVTEHVVARVLDYFRKAWNAGSQNEFAS